MHSCLARDDTAFLEASQHSPSDDCSPSVNGLHGLNELFSIRAAACGWVGFRYMEVAHHSNVRRTSF